MKIAICDDDDAFVESIYQYIWAEWDCEINTFLNPVDLLAQYEKGIRYDIIFCDIIMEPLDGIETARRIRSFDNHAILIYLTVNLDYAPMGYEVNAYRYLLKPVHYQDIQDILTQIRHDHGAQNKLLLETFIGSVVVPIESILYFETNDKEMLLFCEKETLHLKKTLNELEAELDPSLFFRIHRRFLINLDHVCTYDNLWLTIDNGKTLPISRRRSKAFRSAMKRFIKGENDYA